MESTTRATAGYDIQTAHTSGAAPVCSCLPDVFLSDQGCCCNSDIDCILPGCLPIALCKGASVHMLLQLWYADMLSLATLTGQLDEPNTCLLLSDICDEV